MNYLRPFRHLLLAALGCAALQTGFSHAQSFDSGADQFINAPTIPENGLSLVTSLHTYSNEAGEPEHAPTGTSAGKSAWWKWTAPQSGWCTLDTLELPPDSPIKNSVLAVYTGSNVSSLTAIGKNDDAFQPGVSTPYSRLTFRAIAGITYSIAVDAKNAGDIVFPGHYEVRLRLAFMPDAAFQAVGVILNNETLEHAMLNVSKTLSNSFSGRLSHLGKTYPLRGSHDLSGRASLVIPVKNDPVPIVLHLNFNGLPADIHLEKGQEINIGFLVQVAAPNTLDAAFLGRGTAAVGNNSPGDPYGFGCGSYLVKKSGACTASFILPDGTAFSSSGRAVLTGQPGLIACYMRKPLHRNRGSVLLALGISTTGPNGNAVAVHKRPEAPGSSFYPAGFNVALSGLTNAYSKPATGRFAGALDASNGDGVLTLKPSTVVADPFAGLTTDLNLSLRNKFSFTDTSLKPRLSFNLSTGMITGQIRPDPAKPAIQIRAVAMTSTAAPDIHFVGTYRTPFSTDQVTIDPPPP